MPVDVVGGHDGPHGQDTIVKFVYSYYGTFIVTAIVTDFIERVDIRIAWQLIIKWK